MGCSVSKESIRDGAPKVDVPSLLRNVENFLKTIKGTSLTKKQTAKQTELLRALTKAKRVLLREINKARHELTIAQNKLNKKEAEFSTNPDTIEFCVRIYQKTVTDWKDHLDNFVRFLYMVVKLQLWLANPFAAPPTDEQVNAVIAECTGKPTGELDELQKRLDALPEHPGRAPPAA